MNNLAALLLASSIFISAPVAADVWAEREMLSKIETEIGALEELIKAAKAQSDESYRTTFEYQVLLSDFRKIRRGITHHLTVPMEPVFPSSIDALRSDYTRTSRQ
jgi:RAQPRD family integrative conjugative element protein